LKEAPAVFGRVSVVQIASESSAKERAEGRRLPVSFGRERRIFSTANGTPITPVEQTMISLAVHPSRLAVSATVRSAAVWPAGPVAQFAFRNSRRRRACGWPFDAKMFLGNYHRGGDNKVLRENRGGRSGNVARNNREIERTGFFQSAGRGRETKSMR
jgi:hypothetical protein